MIINTSLVLTGSIFLLLGYLVGVMKMTRLLSGFNEKKVKNKKKLALLIGVTEMVLGLILIGLGFINFQYPEFAVLSSVVIVLGLAIYVNKTMLE